MKQSYRYIIYLASLILFLLGLIFSPSASADFKEKTIKHDFGTTTLTSRPKKIVVLNNLYSEVLMPLGITPVAATTAQEGSDEFSTLFKKEFKKADVVSVGWQKTPDLEKIAELEPDLILMTVHQKDLYDKLSQIAPTVGYLIDTEENWDYTDIALKVADIFDKKSQMKKILKKTSKKQAALAKKVQSQFGDKKLMYVRVTEKDIRYYGYGRMGFLYETYKFNRVADFPAKNMYEIIDTEKIKELNPDLMIVQADSKELLKSKLQKSPVWKELSAVKNKKVLYADYSTWMLGFGVVSQDKIMEQIQKNWLD